MSGGDLWALLGEAERLSEAWESERTEDLRLGMLGAWHIWITHPGGGISSRLGDATEREICTPTVLSRHTGDEDQHLSYKGACLGCGWVAPNGHLIWERGENGAVEDAHDHAFASWRDLPVVGPSPSAGGSRSAAAKDVEAWFSRWAVLLPGGWLERGGPIRTARGAHAGRHVPGRAPGGGYDMGAGALEGAGGQLALFG